jgi:hypothetical protein
MRVNRFLLDWFENVGSPGGFFYELFVEERSSIYSVCRPLEAGAMKH